MKLTCVKKQRTIFIVYFMKREVQFHDKLEGSI